MKKIIFLFIVVIVFILQLALCFSQSDDKDRIKRIGYKEMRAYSYKCSLDGIDESTRKLFYSETFDEQGNIITRIVPVGRTKYMYFFKYDRNNNLINKQFMDEYDGLSITYKYNSENKLIELVEHNPNGISINREESIKYNKKGIMIEKTVRTPQKDNIYKTNYKYDENENEISSTEHNRNSILIGKSNTTNEYNDKNQLINKTRLYHRVTSSGTNYDSTITVSTYTYDDVGNMITYYTTITAPSGSFYDNYDYEYKTFLLTKAKCTTTLPNNTGYIKRWKYDDTGLSIEFTDYDDFDMPISMTVYEYE